MTKRILIVNTLLVSLLSSLCGQNVLIVNYSARGHTAAMARAVAAGTRSAPRASRVRNHLLIKERKGEVHPQFLAKGEALGRRVAELARRLRQGR